MTVFLLYNNIVSTNPMGRTYKRNDPYSSHRAKSLREKRKQSRTKYKRENVNDSTDYVEKYNKPRTQFDSHTEDNHGGRN